jgi:dTDP-4-amino-4,6-dideoxygalactose transaminase
VLIRDDMVRTEAFRIPAPARGSIFDEDELAAVRAVLESGATLTAGAHRDAFERAMAEYLGCAHALTTTSGTVALELAVGLLDLRPGDEVVVTTQTFHATAQPLLDSPATVRFCDVDARTLNMDPSVLERLVGPRTRAVVLVHYGGVIADMARIMEIAHAVGALVIEDCAHALGARSTSGRPGALADIGCFSFHSSKNISTLGEGGLVTLRDTGLAERLRRVRDNRNDVVATDRVAMEALEKLERATPWTVYGDEWNLAVSHVRRAGTNATMSEAAAAVGLVQLRRVDELVARRAMIAGRLADVVARHDGMRVQSVPTGTVSAHHLFTFFSEQGDKSRRAVIRGLESEGVQVRLRYAPLHLAPEWRLQGHGLGDCPVAERDWFEHHLNLPCHPGMRDDDVDYLAESLERVLSRI